MVGEYMYPLVNVYHVTNGTYIFVS